MFFKRHLDSGRHNFFEIFHKYEWKFAFCAHFCVFLKIDTQTSQTREFGYICMKFLHNGVHRLDFISLQETN